MSSRLEKARAKLKYGAAASRAAKTRRCRRAHSKHSNYEISNFVRSLLVASVYYIIFVVSTKYTYLV